jgi:uncharacterized protein YqeY
MLKQRIDQDLKAAMLAQDKVRVAVLRSLKSAILYAEVAQKKREQGLSDPEVEQILTKEVKKRQESADMYRQGGAAERAEAEQAEQQIIEEYLPQQLSDAELAAAVDQAVEAAGGLSRQTMGQVIGKVKAAVGSQADGARIAKAVQQKLDNGGNA